MAFDRSFDIGLKNNADNNVFRILMSGSGRRFRIGFFLFKIALFQETDVKREARSNKYEIIALNQN